MPPAPCINAGAWLNVNGEAVHGSRPWNQGQEGKSLFYTQQVVAKKVYAITLQYPANNLLTLKHPECKKVTEAELLLASGAVSLKHACTGAGGNSSLTITFPDAPLGENPPPSQPPECACTLSMSLMGAGDASRGGTCNVLLTLPRAPCCHPCLYLPRHCVGLDRPIVRA